MKKRSTFKPPLSSLWIPVSKNDFFTVDAVALSAAITRTEKSDDDLKRVIGAAWGEFDMLRSGLGEVGYWTALHFDYALNLRV